MHRATLVQMLGGVLVGTAAALLAVWSRGWQAPETFSTNVKRQRAARKKQAFVLMVRLSFDDVSHTEQFLTFWKPLADHVKAHEPGTLAFELLQPDTEPTELLVYERYVDKEYYLKVHRQSAPMAAFKQCLATASWQLQISGQSYNELNIGFML